MTKRFLSIPRFGTINIHPSLLPKYRGAAPVQRCLMNGDNETGVSVVFTVLKMDAGPILRQLSFPLNGKEKATEILDKSFRLGTNELLSILPSVFDRSVVPVLQVDELATSADKLSSNDSWVDFSQMSAIQIHNKCRAQNEWPGIHSLFFVGESTEPVRIKIITTAVIQSSTDELGLEGREWLTVIRYQNKEVLQVKCGDGSMLALLELQPVGKKVMDAKAFINGFRGNVKIKYVNDLESSIDS